jgi:hypothetical protein
VRERHVIDKRAREQSMRNAWGINPRLCQEIRKVSKGKERGEGE